MTTKPSRVRAERAHQVVVRGRAHPQLGVVHDPLDRRVQIRWELHPHSHVDRSVLGRDPQLGRLLAQPVGPSPARRGDHVACLDLLGALEDIMLALPIDPLHAVLEGPREGSLREQMLIEAVDRLAEGGRPDVALPAAREFNPIAACHLLKLWRGRRVLPGVLRRRAETGECLVDPVDVRLDLARRGPMLAGSPPIWGVRFSFPSEKAPGPADPEADVGPLPRFAPAVDEDGRQAAPQEPLGREQTAGPAPRIATFTPFIGGPLLARPPHAPQDGGATRPLSPASSVRTHADPHPRGLRPTTSIDGESPT